MFYSYKLLIQITETCGCILGYNENVAFHAYVARNTPFSGNDILKFDNVDINIGNNYDLSTGKFTAPKQDCTR